METFKDLINRVCVFEKNYSKKLLEEKQEYVFKLYEGVSEELSESIKEETVDLKIKSGKYDITILIISSDTILISEYEIYLNTLMLAADFKNFKIIDKKIVLELWFRCWEYRK